MRTLEGLEAVVGEAVRSGPFPVESAGGGVWTLEGSDGCRPTLRIEDRWLSLETEVEPLTPNDRLWERMLLSGTGDPGRLVATVPPGVRYRSELWLGEYSDTDIASRVRDFELEFLRPPDSASGVDTSDADFMSACREAHLECAENEGIPDWVYLPGGARQDRAWIHPTGGGFKFRFDIARIDSEASFEHREAVALLLLTVCDMVRLLGASAELDQPQDSDHFQLRLEARVPRAPEPEELSHALGALATGLRLAREETGALADEQTACAYLGVRNSQSLNQHNLA